ncbi:zinc-binding dehydrogenase [Asticcacaulis sp. EMRT-3]|uniref:zinc-binding dehydrogenase n=1 Tax=Asticcacaulis sp. EMRT-3 TaxID=3040349 RepID=UPI0024AFD2DE|nr:zinc-binding dehydrogenase [Asticcacaulis sp. EMRT-3]MDI7773891.1 zinc-binding dehydrogenase [Asticcacaulis sp. EMRT-3]
MAATMKAWVQTRFGGPEVRSLMEVPRPVAQPGEVVLRVIACALNRLDVIQRGMALLDGFQLPHIAGMDFVGEVIEATSPQGEALIGKMVVADPLVTCGRCDRCLNGLSVYCRKSRICGASRPGGMAEYVALPAENCIPVDTQHITLTELACVPSASATAWHGLRGAGRLQPGETVVIPGAGSGLGIAGIQIAKAMGCTVITMAAGPAKVEAARRLGADLVIDRQAVDWVETVMAFTGGAGANMVWDHVGGPFLQAAISATGLNGRVVMSGTTAGNQSTITNTSLFHGGRSIIGHGGYSRQEMRDAIAAYCDGTLKIVTDSLWDFGELDKAEARLESNDFFGKIVVRL